MRAMQERAYAKRGEQYLLFKSPPAWHWLSPAYGMPGSPNVIQRDNEELS